MGGLAAAARLATLGHRVTVCEQSDDVGGKLGWFERDGFAFDTGPSLLTLPAVYRDLFVKTGAPLESEIELEPVDPVCHYRFADGIELDVPNASRARVTAALDGAFGPGAGADWARFMDRAGRIWDVTRRPFLESPLDGLRGLLRESRQLADLRTVAPWRSLRGLGAAYLEDPHLRMLLDRYATYTGSDPRRAPAALATVPYVEQTFGAWWVKGGLRRLGLALHQRVRRPEGGRPHRGARHLAGAVRRPGQRGDPRRGRAAAGRRGRLGRRRPAPLRRPGAGSRRPLSPAAGATGHTLAVRLRPAAGAARSHPRPGTPHGALSRGVRRRVRLGVRHRAASGPPAGRAGPHDLPGRTGRPGAAAGRRPRVGLRPRQRPPPHAGRPVGRASTGTVRGRPRATPPTCSS